MMTRFVVGSLAFGLTVGAVPVHAQNRPGRIEVPARGLIHFEEASVEAWVKLLFDPTEREEGVWRPMGSCFTLDVPKSENDLGAGMSISFGLKNAGYHDQVKSACLMRVGFYVDGRKMPHPVFVDCTRWGQDQWHHVAVTWRDAKFVRVYVDGKPAASMDFPWSMKRDLPARARIVIGHTGYGQSQLAIDEVRVSSIARRPEDTGFHQPSLQTDPFTMLLENFEKAADAGGKRSTAPLLAVTGSSLDFPITGGAIVEGKTGKGFSLR